MLVPVINSAPPGLLLTRRSAQLRKHAGQVAFPGGMQDASDTSLIHTALREAQEEVVIEPHQVQVVGVLPLAEALRLSRYSGLTLHRSQR